MIDPDQYDGFATFEELNLSPEEIEQLRNQKQELTQYGREKLRKLMNTQVPNDDLLEEWLGAPMTEEKKEEMEKYRECWEQARKDALEHKKNNEYWKFLVSTWWEQSCGRTIFLYMSQFTPEGRDFDRDGENPYVPINTQEERAIRKFKEVFGEYFTQDVKFITREEFFTKYAQYLPPRLIELKDELCNIDYYSKFHFNFS